ncbi:MAG: hypothetical protein WCG80_01145 [Spirochaetales bacterium]
MAQPNVPAWVFALAGALVSSVLFHLSLLGVLFLLPLVWLNKRHSQATALEGAAATAALLICWTFGRLALEKSTWTVWDSLDLGLPLFLLAGWVALVLLNGTGWRFVYRLGAVTLVAAVIGLPLVTGLLAVPAVEKAWKDGFEIVWKQIAEASGSAGLQDWSANKDDFFVLVRESISAAFLPVLFLFWAATESWSRRWGWSGTGPVRWVDFRLPSRAVVVFLGLWMVILVQSLVRNLGGRGLEGVLWYGVANLAIVAWIAYALVGWGIVKSLLQRGKVPPLAQTLMGMMLILSLFAGGVMSVVVLIALPLLAVLELWIDFRKTEQRG